MQQIPTLTRVQVGQECRPCIARNRLRAVLVEVDAHEAHRQASGPLLVCQERLALEPGVHMDGAPGHLQSPHREHTRLYSAHNIKRYHAARELRITLVTSPALPVEDVRKFHPVTCRRSRLHLQEGDPPELFGHASVISINAPPIHAAKHLPHHRSHRFRLLQTECAIAAVMLY